MEVGKHDVVELWIGKRGYEPAGLKKLVLVKYDNGEVIAWDMDVSVLVENGEDDSGQKVQAVDGEWTEALLLSNAEPKWRTQEDALTPGKYQWSDMGGGKGIYETKEAREESKRRRLAGECIVVPQKVLLIGSDGDALEFLIFRK